MVETKSAGKDLTIFISSSRFSLISLRKDPTCVKKSLTVGLTIVLTDVSHVIIDLVTPLWQPIRPFKRPVTPSKTPSTKSTSLHPVHPSISPRSSPRIPPNENSES